MKDYISLLVQQALNEYFKEAFDKPHILIMLTNSRVDSSLMSNHILELSKRYTISLIVSETEQKYTDSLYIHRVFTLESITMVDIVQFSKMVDLMYCPSISHGFLAKLSMLLDDTNSIWIVLQMLLKGKKVLLGNNVFKQNKVANIWHNSSLETKVQSYIKDLKQDGVYFCSMKQATEVISKLLKKHQNKKPLLLAKHIEEIAHTEQQEITVPHNSIITPMAIDAAKQLRVAIKKET